MHSFSPYAYNSRFAQGLIYGLKASDSVIIAVDNALNMGMPDADSFFSIRDPGAIAMPTDGDAAIIYDSNDLNWLYFPGDAGDVIHLQAQTTSSHVECSLYSPFLTLFVPTVAFAYDAWLQLSEAGYYYLGCANGDAADYTIQFAREHVTPTPVVIGTGINGATLSANNRNWFELDVSDADWLVFSGDPSSFDGDMLVDFYGRTNAGEIDSAYVLRVDGFRFGSSGTQVARIVAGDNSRFLIAISDDGSFSAGAPFSLSVNNRVFSDLGVITNSTPISQIQVSIAADEVLYYLVWVDAQSTSEIEILASGDSPVMTATRWLDTDESPLAQVGDGIPLHATDVARGYVAFSVTETAGQAGDFDLVLQATP